VGHESTWSAVVLSGAGGGLLRGILDKGSPFSMKQGLAALLADDEIEEYHPALNLVQHYFDAVDGLNQAMGLLMEVPEGRGRPNLFFVYGVGDSYTPTSTQRALGVALGAPLVEPVLEPYGGVYTMALPVRSNVGGVTALARQYAPTDDWDGHFVATREATAMANIDAFLASFLATGLAEVPAP